jgi:hypothetical protein
VEEGFKFGSTTFKTVRAVEPIKCVRRYTNDTYKISPNSLELVGRRRLIVTAKTVSAFVRHEEEAHLRFSFYLGNVRHKVHVNGLDRGRFVRESGD